MTTSRRGDSNLTIKVEIFKLKVDGIKTKFDGSNQNFAISKVVKSLCVEVLFGTKCSPVL